MYHRQAAKAGDNGATPACIGLDGLNGVLRMQGSLRAGGSVFEYCCWFYT